MFFFGGVDANSRELLFRLYVPTVCRIHLGFVLAAIFSEVTMVDKAASFSDLAAGLQR